MRPPRPEALLADWRAAGLPFRRRPELIGELAGGRSNRSFLISADGARWVLRLDGADAGALGVDRDREARTHRAAAAAGLAPELLVADAARGFVVTRFVEGDRHTAPPVPRKRLECLLTLLDAVSTLEVEGPPLDYHAHAASYTVDAALPADLAARIARIERAGETGLCHHDPAPANVVFTARRAMLLDWEYAAPGRPVMDLAALVCEWQVEVQTVAAASAVDAALLGDACAVYRALCDLWLRRLECAATPGRL